MRHTFFFLVMGSLLTINNGWAQTVPPPRLLPPIPLKLNEANTNDRLVELGRAAHLNFLADATQFSESELITSDSTQPLKQHLADLNSKQNLTWFPRKQVLLFWTTPDIRQLAQRLAEGQTIKLITPEPTKADAPLLDDATIVPLRPTPKLSSEEILFKEVSAYFQEKLAWDASTPGSIKEIKISDLPPALRSRVGAATQSSLLGPESLSIWSAWFNDKFWDNAELKMVDEDNGVQNGPKIPVLTIGGSIQTRSMRGGSMMSLGALKERPTN